ncbi:response regulator [Piscirickettsia litoralis]|uniref:Response regulatory domain-containing protein n=1 Tax=Piscirickettsia litoralis TaxID=1891921 RepID=A0ABX3A4F0_9GAMM|nr:response regulator [Piscirickettsia litoralis]ODN43723.1 hypothetical protein BGC07_13485 [Piscirickettsia litoralis]
MQILIIDDEERVLDSLKRLILLKYKNAKITEARCGKEAVDSIKNQTFDIVISDRYMGGLDGDAVLRYARKIQPKAKRIMYSGYTDDESIRSAIESGDIEYLLEKGCSKQSILDVLEEIFLLKESSS